MMMMMMMMIMIMMKEFLNRINLSVLEIKYCYHMDPVRF